MEGRLNTFSQEQEVFLDSLFRKIEETYQDRLISLAVYGSYARGEARLNSDLDLFIVLRGSNDNRSARRDQFIAQIENPLEKDRLRLASHGIRIELSPLILNQSEADRFLPIYLDMVDSCVVIRDQGDFLKRRLLTIREKMRRWGSRRHEVAGGWYWEIQPGLKWNETIDYDQ